MELGLYQTHLDCNSNMGLFHSNRIKLIYCSNSLDGVRGDGYHQELGPQCYQ